MQKKLNLLLSYVAEYFAFQCPGLAAGPPALVIEIEIASVAIKDAVVDTSCPPVAAPVIVTVGIPTVEPFFETVKVQDFPTPGAVFTYAVNFDSVPATIT